MKIEIILDGESRVYHFNNIFSFKMGESDDIMLYKFIIAKDDKEPKDGDGYQYKREKSTWKGMLSRCHNENNLRYHDYGGRGITVCDSWRESFRNFITDMGRAPGKEYTIDRIDNDKGYSKENCRWTTRDVQPRNSRQNHFIQHDGKTLCIKDASDVLGITRGSFTIMRDKKGWTDQQTFDYYLEHGKKSDTPGKKVMLLGEEMHTNTAIKKIGITPWSFYRLKKIMGVDNQTLINELSSPRYQEVLDLLPYKPAIR